MSNVIIEKSKIDILANAISAKSGEPVTMTLDEMVEAVDGIETNPPPTLQTKSVTYTPSTSAVTGTVTADSGYDGLEEVDVTVSAVPMADAGPAAGRASFLTESGVRKWKFEYGAYAEEAGWVDEGPIGTNAVYKYNAVPSNTTVTPTESSQTVGGENYMMEGAVTVSAIPSNYVGSGVTRRSSSDLTASGATVTAPAGYYSSAATKTVASGTEGTPTATKGTVANNAVTVTPSVTNAVGYIPGGTHTGTAVTVTASELVSGSQTITTNGTYDVTTLASIVAAIESGGGGIVRENIVPEQTVTAAAEWTRLTSTSSILEGEYYAYTVDGEERLGTGVKANDNVYLADIDCLWDLSGAGFLSSIYYDNVVYLTPVAAGTYTVKVDKITLANGGLKTQVIFPEQSVTATTTEQSGYSANISVSENITDGANYIVTIDGTAYLCYGKQLYGNNDVYCGDDTVIWGTPANARYPFMVATWGNGTTAWGVADTTAHTVKIEKVLSFDSAELGTKTITANGTYTASTDDLDGYSTITVNVSGGSVNIATATTTNSSNQNTSIDFTLPSGRTPKAFFCRLTSQIARSSNSRYYYVYDMRWDGSSNGGVEGNTFYMYSGTLTNVTSGYSYSQSNTTYTLSSTGSRSASPGSFFNGTYELVYVY